MLQRLTIFPILWYIPLISITGSVGKSSMNIGLFNAYRALKDNVLIGDFKFTLKAGASSVSIYPVKHHP